MACVAATTKPSAAAHEHPQPRQESDAPDRSAIAQFAMASPPSPTVAAARAAADGMPSGPSASLAEIIQAWPKLSQPIQTAITAIIHAALGNCAG
jgi:predicted RNA polymerase sigma factor